MVLKLGHLKKRSINTLKVCGAAEARPVVLSVKNEELCVRVKQKRNILHKIKKEERQLDWTHVA
jgi:hypothetical protein